MASTLYQKDAYISTAFNYAISQYVREYDISKANISILLQYGIITSDDYDEYLRLDKMQRQIKIGILARDNPKANQALKDGFKEARRLFFEANEIEDKDVLSIKKDAIFLLNKVANVLDFNHIHFIPKNTYTSYYHFPTHNLEFYYYLDTVNRIETLDVKGIGDMALSFHEQYMLDYLKFIFETSQTATIEEVISLSTTMYQRYIQKELSIGYYRELNSQSKFKISSSKLFTYYADHVSDVNILDISCNSDLIRILNSYYSNIYLATKSMRTIKTK